MALGYLLKIPSVNDYIFDADFDQMAEDVTQKYKLPSERAGELSELVYAVLDEVVGVVEVPGLVSEAYGIDRPTAEAVTADFLGPALLPLVNYLPQIENDILALGGKLDDYSIKVIAKDDTAKHSIIKEVLTRLNLSFDDVLTKRLIFLLQQYAKSEKTETSIKTFFTRAKNIGGLGLSDEQASALLVATLPQAASFLEDIQVASVVAKVETPAVAKQELEITPTHELAAEVPVVSHQTTTIPPVPPRPQMSVKTPAAKIDRLPIQADIDPSELKTPAKKATAARELTADVQDTFETTLVLATNNATAVLKKNKISEKVFADLAGKAIKGLRDIYQTRDIVERDWKLKGQDLATLMAAITSGVDAYQSAPRPAVSKTSAIPASYSDDQQLDQRFKQLTDGQVKDTIKPTRAQLTVGSVVPTTSDGQRKMVDVISATRLVGPIEQLGKMSPTEFRRLSSSATEAAQKIEDLLAALQATSYEDRIKGVLAWRDSPMNQLYLLIAEEALSQGLALPEVSSRRRAAGQDSLSPAEIKALALLNSQIRF